MQKSMRRALLVRLGKRRIEERESTKKKAYGGRRKKFSMVRVVKVFPRRKARASADGRMGQRRRRRWLFTGRRRVQRSAQSER